MKGFGDTEGEIISLFRFFLTGVVNRLGNALTDGAKIGGTSFGIVA